MTKDQRCDLHAAAGCEDCFGPREALPSNPSVWRIAPGDPTCVFAPGVVKPIKCGSQKAAALIVAAVNAYRPADETPGNPLSDGEVCVIYEHGEPTGVRDRTGFLCHFNRVSKYAGQEDRYRRELALRARQAEVIAAALRSAQETSEPRLDPNRQWESDLEDRLAVKASESLPTCQHDLLKEPHTIVVHHATHASCTVCKKHWHIPVQQQNGSTGNKP